MNQWYTDYAEYLQRFFPGVKVQKISVNIGAGCPNRDGTIGHGGCIYCNNTSFTPSYCFDVKGVSEQLEAGKRFFARKYPAMQYLAYFQSYTNTYRMDAAELERIYREALSTKGVVGLIIGTRPDCIPPEVVEMLSRLNQERPVFVELGVETLCDETLRLINRGHDSDRSREAIRTLAAAGLHVGVHLIAGLPGEDEERVMQTVSEICSLPVESIKLHHLQVLRDTPLHHMWVEKSVNITPYDPERYLELCRRIVKTVPRHIAIERFLASAPPALVVAPKWGLKNYEFTDLLINKLKEHE